MKREKLKEFYLTKGLEENIINELIEFNMKEHGSSVNQLKEKYNSLENEFKDKNSKYSELESKLNNFNDYDILKQENEILKKTHTSRDIKDKIKEKGLLGEELIIDKINPNEDIDIQINQLIEKYPYLIKKSNNEEVAKSILQKDTIANQKQSIDKTLLGFKK